MTQRRRMSFGGWHPWVAGLVLVSLSAVPAAAASSGSLSDAEREELLASFAESAELFLGRLATVSDAQWSWKPAPDRWSVAECAEHIVLSNESLFQTAQVALQRPADPDWEEKSLPKGEFMRRVMPVRSTAPPGTPSSGRGVQAPQEMRPTGNVTRSEVVERFQALYETAREFVATTKAPLKEHLHEHPFPVFNPLNAHDWVYYVPLHTIRHTKQMIEVMETEGYPGG